MGYSETSICAMNRQRGGDEEGGETLLFVTVHMSPTLFVSGSIWPHLDHTHTHRHTQRDLELFGYANLRPCSNRLET